MKTKIINKSKGIQRVPVALLLITLLSAVIMTVSAQEDSNSLTSLSYSDILSQTDSEIMDNIIKIRFLKNTSALKDKMLEPENRMRISPELQESSADEKLFSEDTELESWMKNLSEFGEGFEKKDQRNLSVQNNLSREVDNKFESGMESILDESLNLERWMINLSDWDLIKYENVTEPELELETWMTDLSEWD